MLVLMSREQAKKVTNCPQCKGSMKEIIFDIRYGLEVNALHCARCGFNRTEEQALNNTVDKLKKHMVLE